MATTSQGYKINKHPIAQSFFVDAVNGIFVTKIDLYFAAKDNDFPVNLQLRTMDNGYPSSTEIIPGTQVIVPGSNISTSADATVATTFTFTEPVYLKGLTDYAIVLTADSKDYTVYVAETNEFLIGSTEKRVDRQPVLGSLFYSQNSTTFTAIQNQDLTFRLHQAKFRSSTGEAVLHNANLPRKLLYSDPIKVTSGSSTVTVRHINHGLQVGEDINITNIDSAGVGGISYANLTGTRTITKVDWTGYQYTAGANADSDVIGGGDYVLSTKNIPYHIIYPHVQSLVPKNTNIDAGIKATTGKSFAGSETSFQKASSYLSIDINKDNVAKFPYLIANSASETTELGANVKSLDISIQMSSSDSNVAPIVDMQRTSASLIGHIIDKQDSSATSGFNVPITYVDETQPTNGSSAGRHIMTPITLDQDAVGLKIITSAHRPSAADFLLYYRTATGDEILSDKNWVYLPEETNNPSDENSTVFREYRYLAGGLSGSLPAFTQFQIKIVMRSTNSAKVPVFGDLRVIALSV
jgi:hypothetical protein